MVQRQFNNKVKSIRSDNALELGKGTIDSEFIVSHGILHQTSYISTPQQYLIVERKHRHLLQTSRAFLFQSNVSISYWEKCLLTATFLMNSFSSRVLNGKTPHEVLFGSPPKYHFLKTFGCLCYESTSTQNRSNHKSCSLCFLGYPPGKKGYKLLYFDSKGYLYQGMSIFMNLFSPLNPIPLAPPIFSSSPPLHVYEPPFSPPTPLQESVTISIQISLTILIS